MLVLHTLGQTCLHDSDGRVVDSVFDRPQVLAVLVYLACAEGRRHPRDALLAMFWPHVDTDHARNSLRQTLHLLRRALGGAVIRSHGRSFLAIERSHLKCDAERLRTALAQGRRRAAVRLYRGDFLPAIHIRHAPDFERWIQTTGDALRRGAADAAEHLAREADAMGRLDPSVRWWRRAVEMRPLSEPTFRRLFDVLVRSRRTNEAARAYSGFLCRVRRDLDREPSPELVAYARRSLATR